MVGSHVSDQAGGVGTRATGSASKLGRRKTMTLPASNQIGSAIIGMNTTPKSSAIVATKPSHANHLGRMPVRSVTIDVASINAIAPKAENSRMDPKPTDGKKRPMSATLSGGESPNDCAAGIAASAAPPTQ